MLDWQHLFRQLMPLYSIKEVDSWLCGKAAVHLALMQGDFLEAIIKGSKTIESRFTRARIAPVGSIEAGDLVVFKQVGRDRMAVGVVDRAVTGAFDEEAWKMVRKLADEIGVDADYLKHKAESRYYALVWIRNVHVISPVKIEKKDRRAWVLLRPRNEY